MTNGAGWRSRLLNDRWFGGLPAGLQDSLLGAVRQRRITPGKLLFARGDTPCGLYVLVEGMLRLGAVDEQLPARNSKPMALPYWFGEVSLFDGLPRTADVYSTEQSIFLHVPQATLLELLEQHPAYWRPFAELLGHKLGLPLLRPEALAQLHIRTQVTRRLLLLSEGYGDLNRTQRLIALADIASPPTLALDDPALQEVLQALHERQVVHLGRAHLEVLNVSKLRQLAGVKNVRSSAQQT
jgi:CRP-like cAMP-binding protein